MSFDGIRVALVGDFCPFVKGEQMLVLVHMPLSTFPFKFLDGIGGRDKIANYEIVWGEHCFDLGIGDEIKNSDIIGGLFLYFSLI